MRAIVSVSDRRGVVELASGLAELGVTVYATTGTRQHLDTNGVKVDSIEQITGMSEILGGRVKTLHHIIHAGIQADPANADDLRDLAQLGAVPIEMVVVNLRSFQTVIQQANATEAEALNSVDIGGSTLLRAAARNCRHVLAIVDPDDYQDVLGAMRVGGVDDSLRRRLAAKAFQHTASYDSAVAGFLRDPGRPLPDQLTLSLEKVADLRYGENPHQRGALYVQSPNPRPRRTLAGALKLTSKRMSFANTLDLDAALACVREFAAPAVAIYKHGNPCGIAVGPNLADAYRRAYSGDPVSAIGAGIAINRPVDAETAHLIATTFYEDIVASGYDAEALEVLRTNHELRVFQVDMGPLDEAALRISPSLALDLKRVGGGFLVQTPDVLADDETSFRSASSREPTLEELTNLIFAWKAVKHAKSNAVVLAKRLALVGVGAGQTSRGDATDLAIRKAESRASGSVLASDAYFPRTEPLLQAANAGVTAIVQPDGGARNDEIARLADEYHMALVLTDYRHYSH
jgi:phosphoribosylaminoimidazolecarboxamide formyltransferase / IMP cyclohydrolase